MLRQVRPKPRLRCDTSQLAEVAFQECWATQSTSAFRRVGGEIIEKET
jgi:hypothetical protein